MFLPMTCIRGASVYMPIGSPQCSLGVSRLLSVVWCPFSFHWGLPGVGGFGATECQPWWLHG